jgi:hypothetical protein
MSGTRSLKWPVGKPGILTATSCRLTAVIVLGLLSAAAAVVMARALVGALQTPLEPAVLLTACLLVTVAAVVVRLGWLLPLVGTRISRLDLTVMVVTSFAATTLCSGLCSPRDTLPEMALLLRVVIVLEEGCAWLWFLRKRGQNYFSPTKSPSNRPPHEKNSSDPFITETIPAAEVLQRLTRSQAVDGAEELAGWLRLPFAPGQRTGNVHVAFCPPLRIAPEMAVEQIEGPEARIKTAQLLPYGARFDLKLAVAAEGPTTVLLQFTARTPREK